MNIIASSGDITLGTSGSAWRVVKRDDDVIVIDTKIDGVIKGVNLAPGGSIEAARRVLSASWGTRNDAKALPLIDAAFAAL